MYQQAAPIAAAQSKSPSGTYGFVLNAAQIDSAGETGLAAVGLMTFDGHEHSQKPIGDKDDASGKTSAKAR
jgi:hypothetical protein